MLSMAARSSPRISKLSGPPFARRCRGMERMVRTLSVTTSPLSPSPRELTSPYEPTCVRRSRCIDVPSNFHLSTMVTGWPLRLSRRASQKFVDLADRMRCCPATASGVCDTPGLLFYDRSLPTTVGGVGSTHSGCSFSNSSGRSSICQVVIGNSRGVVHNSCSLVPLGLSAQTCDFHRVFFLCPSVDVEFEGAKITI